ncbi:MULTISPECIES: hypothetical protein [Sulfurimonas]|jgi:hypothetical protein|uniref:Uncharacterized protein n=1 Tax=Sulfurimonas xiamenensis TaxID=2590021 RepID=A0AAJ4DLP9_9BACT|nr:MULTISPECIES: hypothetical protein [Sulfurimonas]QFR42429.1 hypothetical protein FJR47_00250 [Sulfurimonas xiamenensis]
MKLNILISLLFAVVTSFAAVHEVEHIQHNDSASCLICTVSQNLISDDSVQLLTDIELFHFEKITQNNLLSYIFTKINSNQNRAPPSTIIT